jgi:hypothetical protein
MPGFLCRIIFAFYVRPTTVYVLSFFGQNRYRRRNYQEYVQKGAALGRRPELVGGGLVRSLGGWSEVCKKHNISLGELCSGGRRRDVAKARVSISWIAVRELGYSGADVARYLGVTNSCVTRFVASGQKPDIDDLITKL